MDAQDAALSPDGELLYVLDGDGQLIVVHTVDADGSISASSASWVIDLADAGVVEPSGLAVHPETGDLYVSDASDGTIKHLSVDGVLLATHAADEVPSMARHPQATTSCPTSTPRRWG